MNEKTFIQVKYGTKCCLKFSLLKNMVHDGALPTFCITYKALSPDYDSYGIRAVS